MAGLQINPNDIAKARESGYSDDEIATFLSEKNPEQFKQAREAGYNASEILQHLSGTKPEEKPSGIVAGFQQGLSENVKGLGQTGKYFAGQDDSGFKSAAETMAPKDYKSAPIIREGGNWYNPMDYRPGNIPQALAEQAPGVGQDFLIGSTVGKANKWAGLAAGVGSALYRTLGPMAKENAVARTGDVNAEPNSADKTRAGITSAVQAPLNAVALGRVLPGVLGKTAGVGVEGATNALKKYGTTVAVEGATGVARDLVGQTGTTIGTDDGLKIDGNRAAASGVTSAAGGALLAAPRLTGDTAVATKFREFGGDNAEAATALANRQMQAADGKKLVGALGGTKHAREAVQAAHTDVHTELKAAAKDLDLSTDNANTLTRIQNDGKASKSELNALAGEAPADVVQLARQALLSKKLKEMGDFNADTFNGGLSGMMDKSLRPLYNPTATIASAAAAAAGHAGGLGMIGMAAPQLLGAVYGTYAGARALDKVTGARSPAQGFTDKFADANVPTRAPAPVLPEPAPEAAPVPTLRAELNTNAKLDEGISKIVGKLGADKRKAMIAEAKPLLNRLAESRAEPAAPEAPWAPNSVALKMAQQKMKQGLPPEPVAPPPAPEPAPVPPPAPEFSGTALKMLQQKLKQGLPKEEPAPMEASVTPEFNPTALSMLKQKLKQGLPAPSPEAPETLKTLAATAPDAPAPIPAGTPASPEIGELIARMRAKSKAPQPVTAPPAENVPPIPRMGEPPIPVAPSVAPQMPEPPVIKRITKKAGKVEQEEAFSKEYVPLDADQLWGKGMRDEEFAQTDASKKSGLHDPEAYMDGIIRDRKKRRGILADLIGDDDMSGQHGADLLEALHHTRRASEADGAIKHFTSKMPPKMRDKIRKRMDKSFINSMWKT